VERNTRRDTEPQKQLTNICRGKTTEPAQRTVMLRLRIFEAFL